jgi:hypothetical protein
VATTLHRFKVQAESIDKAGKLKKFELENETKGVSIEAIKKTGVSD